MRNRACSSAWQFKHRRTHLSNSVLMSFIILGLIQARLDISKSLLDGSRWWKLRVLEHRLYPQYWHFPPLYSIQNCFSADFLSNLYAFLQVLQYPSLIIATPVLEEGLWKCSIGKSFEQRGQVFRPSLRCLSSCLEFLLLKGEQTRQYLRGVRSRDLPSINTLVGNVALQLAQILILHLVPTFLPSEGYALTWPPASLLYIYTADGWLSIRRLYVR